MSSWPLNNAMTSVLDDLLEAQQKLTANNAQLTLDLEAMAAEKDSMQQRLQHLEAKVLQLLTTVDTWHDDIAKGEGVLFLSGAVPVPAAAAAQLALLRQTEDLGQAKCALIADNKVQDSYMEALKDLADSKLASVSLTKERNSLAALLTASTAQQEQVRLKWEHRLSMQEQSATQSLSGLQQRMEQQQLQHAEAVQRLQQEVAAKEEVKQQVEAALQKERQALHASMASLQDTRNEAQWKKKLTTLQAALQQATRQRDHYKAMCSAQNHGGNMGLPQ